MKPLRFPEDMTSVKSRSSGTCASMKREKGVDIGRISKSCVLARSRTALTQQFFAVAEPHSTVDDFFAKLHDNGDDRGQTAQRFLDASNCAAHDGMATVPKARLLSLMKVRTNHETTTRPRSGTTRLTGT